MAYLGEVPLYCTRRGKTGVSFGQKSPFSGHSPPSQTQSQALPAVCRAGGPRGSPSPTHLPKVPLPLGCSFIHFQRG